MIRRVAADAGVNLALQAGSVGLGLVIGVVLSRLLGAEGLGVYAFAMSLATLLGTVARLGLSTLLVREVAVAMERGDGPAASSLVSWSQRASLGVALGLAAWVLLCTAVFASADTLAAVGLGMAVLVFMTATTLRCAALRGLNAVVLASVPLSLVRPVAVLAGLGGLAALSLSRPWQAVGASALGWGIALVASLWLWTRRAPEVRSPAPTTPGRWLRAAMPLLLLDGLLVTIHQSDILMLKGLATDAETGIYSIASQLGRVTALVLVAAKGVLSPRFAALHAAGDREGLQHLVRSSARGVTAVTVVLATLLVLGGSEILSLYAPGFERGYLALVVIVLGQAMNAMAGSVGYLLVMTGHDGDVARVSLVIAGLNLALNAALIPVFSMAGAAVASALSVALWNAALVVLVRRRLGLNPTALRWPL